MKKWFLMVSVAALILCVSVGCSKKDDDDTPAAAGGTLTLRSTASPAGDVRENVELDSGFEIRLTVNRAGAKIYYTASGSSGDIPADPDLASSVYDSATPFVLDTSYNNGTFVVKYFAWYQDPKTLNMEQEYPFNTSEYYFRPDIKKPTVTITPPGGAYGDPSTVTITITASDPPNDASTCTIYYETTDDGTDPPDPTTSSTSGPGDGTVVAWTGGTLKIAAIAVDAAGNQSSVARATFSIDAAQAAAIVLEKINDARELLGYDRLSMNNAFANGCATHCEVIWNAEHGTGTLIKPAGKEGEGLIPYWYEQTDNRQLIDWDDGDSIGFVITMLGGKTHFPVGMHAGSADEFFTAISGMTSLWDALMEPGPPLPVVGIGCYEDVWELIVANDTP
jgi:hypothetical protein